jgi:hypothetical protein
MRAEIVADHDPYPMRAPAAQLLRSATSRFYALAKQALKGAESEADQKG